jgi:fluoride exporter
LICKNIVVSLGQRRSYLYAAENRWPAEYSIVVTEAHRHGSTVPNRPGTFIPPSGHVTLRSVSISDNRGLGLNRYLLISLGAVLGANARYLVGLWSVDRFGAGFPMGTLLVNATGSFVLGFLVTALEGRLPLPSDLRFFLGVGFLGAYTTFSSYTVETLLLLREGSVLTGVINMITNNVAGLAAALLGVFLARWIG